MKIFKWKIFAITGAVCLSPILLGLALWHRLPDTMAIHFNIYGVADNFAAKPFVVFGIPLLMVLLQAFCCLINDINAYKYGERKKFELVTKWIIPCLTIALQVVTLGYGIGWKLDIRRIVSVIVGVIFLVIGNYLPKFDHIKHFDVDTQKTRKINRFIGYESVVMGLLFFTSTLLPPVSAVICVCLLIPYAIVSIIYAIVIGRKQE